MTYSSRILARQVVDEFIRNPAVRQGELASRFGVSQPTISYILSGTRQYDPPLSASDREALILAWEEHRRAVRPGRVAGSAFSPEQEAEMLEAYAAGASQEELAKAYGVSQPTISKVCRGAGVTGARRRPRLPDEVVINLRRNVALGESIASEARDAGIGYQTAFQIVHRYSYRDIPPTAEELAAQESRRRTEEFVRALKADPKAAIAEKMREAAARLAAKQAASNDGTPEGT